MCVPIYQLNKIVPDVESFNFVHGNVHINHIKAEKSGELPYE